MCACTHVCTCLCIISANTENTNYVFGIGSTKVTKIDSFLPPCFQLHTTFCIYYFSMHNVLRVLESDSLFFVCISYIQNTTQCQASHMQYSIAFLAYD